MMNERTGAEEKTPGRALYLLCDIFKRIVAKMRFVDQISVTVIRFAGFVIAEFFYNFGVSLFILIFISLKNLGTHLFYEFSSFGAHNHSLATVDFVKKVNELDPGFSLEYDGTSYYIVYPQCYCSCVKRIDGQLPKAWCYCTLGYSRRMFETILGKEAEGELLSSIKAGDDVCRIRITVQA